MGKEKLKAAGCRENENQGKDNLHEVGCAGQHLMGLSDSAWLLVELL